MAIKSLTTVPHMRIRVLMSLALLSAGFAHAQTTASTTASPPTATETQQAPSASPAASEQAVEAAAKDAAQNPVAAAISLPFQNNTYYNVGPYRRAQNVLLVEPVVPFKLNKNWIVISRTITPVEVVPRLSPAEGVDYGLGNIQPQLYLSPSHPGKFIWGQAASSGCQPRRTMCLERTSGAAARQRLGFSTRGIG